ncbi:hypothetical protein GJ744_011889 [Endocarpon pusillum]|uniref:Uncharacterized protein n=1 Tax=Endocarpon pusillum TaxID=364733 RepID=A0A8H7AFU7_9EURO|nr:hypothetical protein GJ744_011889 [Endocarpon pusillum]
MSGTRISPLPFKRLNIPNQFLSRFIFFVPALPGDSTADMLIFGKLLAREFVSNLLILSVFPVDNIREYSMPHHDEVDGTSQSKEVRFDVRIEGIVSRAVEPTGLPAPAVKEHLTVFRQLFPLEVGKLDVKLLVEK